MEGGGGSGPGKWRHVIVDDRIASRPAPPGVSRTWHSITLVSHCHLFGLPRVAAYLKITSPLHSHSRRTEETTFWPSQCSPADVFASAQGGQRVGALAVWKTGGAAESRNTIRQLRNVTSTRGAWPVLTKSRDSGSAFSDVRGAGLVRGSSVNCTFTLKAQVVQIECLLFPFLFAVWVYGRKADFFTTGWNKKQTENFLCETSWQWDHLETPAIQNSLWVPWKHWSVLPVKSLSCSRCCATSWGHASCSRWHSGARSSWFESCPWK